MPIIHTATPDPRTPRKRRAWAGLLAVVVLAPLVAWLLRPTSALDLAPAHRLQQAGIFTEWAGGNMVVVVRHAERCDRSQGQCLGDPSGITTDGARVAASAGQALNAMGMQDTDVISSPAVRTLQTSQAMFSRPVDAVNWLQACDKHAIEDVMALKKPGRNLMVITHSECIDAYESQLDVGSTPASGYASALFISKRDDDPAKALGYLDASAWPRLRSEAIE